jgi:glucose-6-phosphate dehydrogenase assembly protein OpcA
MAGDMTGPTTPDVQDNAPVPVSVREIESQLDSAWENMQREAVKIGAAVTRASMSNVIIVCDHRNQIEDLTESIALLVVRHPARVLLLAAGADRGQPVLAEVYAHCRRLGDGIQLCCEHILVEFYVEDVDRVASVVRPLLIGDLPTALWWAGAGTPTSTGALFDTLADLGTCGQPDG